MKSRALERLFPRLSGSDYAITSPALRRYNCIAWAAGEESRWWEPGLPVGGYFWPSGAPQENTVEGWSQAFVSHGGYQSCDNGELEEGMEKIAIYAAADGTPTHVARQLPSGDWTSKLGRFEDIRHATLESLADDPPAYGRVVRFLKR